MSQRSNYPLVTLSLMTLLALAVELISPAKMLAEEPQVDPQLKQQIDMMKINPRGPFNQVRWFCEDGTILPPTQRGCKAVRGTTGLQHGQWSEETVALRNKGYSVGTVFAGLKTPDFARFERNPREFAPLVVERFLVTVDDGWVLRGARSYRGAFQVEEEVSKAEELLRYLIASDDFREKHFLMLREGARLLPRSSNSTLLTEIRALATQIARSDRGFTELRNKVHGYPESSDYQRITDYAEKHRRSSQYSRYLSLADKIKEFYGERNLLSVFTNLAARLPAKQLTALNSLAAELRAARSPASYFLAYSNALALFRDEFVATRNPALGLALLDASIQVEQNLFAKARDLSPELRFYPLNEQFSFIEAGIQALYGSGLLTHRETLAARASVDNLRISPLYPKRYYDELNYLSNVSAWAIGQLRWEFGPAVEKLAEIEPMTNIFFADQLRQSTLLFIAEDLSLLESHALRLLGITHSIFDKEHIGDFKVLNPGVARATLVDPSSSSRSNVAPENSVYLVSEFDEALPAIAGIITERQGNMLSHVQLLARNLGIPNVVASEKILPQLQALRGQEIFLAASPRGRVKISRTAPAEFLELEQNTKVEKVTVEKDDLDLSQKDFISLATIRGSDSGILAGPKAAKLGSLKEKYPNAVANGVVVPFGVYNQMLQTDVGGGQTMESWIDEEYENLSLYREGSAERRNATARLLKEIRERITGLSLSDSFKTSLRNAIEANIGPIGKYGLFVRSDTNVEDLPNFSGAGLNLTLPNIVQFDEVVKGLLAVWASPFTDRAFSWRQLHMTNPNDVYVSVLIMQTVPVEKSGVLITSDIASGDPTFLTIASNFGIGGAVDNQSAEVIRIDRKNGAVRLYNSATSQNRRVANPEGGLMLLPSPGTERVLSESELVRLYDLAKDVEQKAPELFRSDNRTAAADIEFGFFKDRLILFQIRPVAENKKVRSFLYLQELDKGIPKNIKPQPIVITSPPLVPNREKE